jgi:hypothetical protein
MGESPSLTAENVWIGALEGATCDGVARAVMHLRTTGNGWPPTAPEFRALAFGVPPVTALLAEFETADRERTPFARLVWSYVDSWAYRQASRDQAGRMLREAYEKAREHVLQGGALPTHSPALEAPSSGLEARLRTHEVGRRALADIEQFFGGAA